MSNKISLLEVKQALRDSRFRASLPEELKEDMQKYEQNPGCACNMPIYHKVLKLGKKQLQEYFPNREVIDPEKEIQKLAENNWMVINCKADELEQRLKQLPPGRKQLAVARYEDQITVIVNELDLIYS